MKEFVEFIVKSLVDNPDKVEIEVKEEEPNVSVFSLKLVKEDIGKVIGKKGKTIDSFRTIATAVASRQKKKVVIKIIEPEV